jgi:caffeoyl-CoA O-methyltransferase
MRVQRFLSDAIDDYAVRHTTPLPPLLAELVATTEARLSDRARMMSGPVEATLLQMLAAALDARRILEVGTFTGFSALMLAAALPADGELITCDRNLEALALARAFFARSPHGHKIQIREGPALETLETLTGPFDLVFLDADKTEYTAYYEAALPLLSPHGIIAVDDALGIHPRADRARPVAEFNQRVARDPRVTHVLLPVGAGLLLVQRKEGIH